MRSTSLSDEDVIAALQGEIFYNPVTDEWEHKGKFIAGSVMAKCTEFVSSIPDLSEGSSNGRKYPSRHWRTQRPNRYLMKSWISIWASVGLTRNFTPTLRQNFFGVEAEVMYFDVNDTYVVRLKGYSRQHTTPIPCAI